MQRSFIALVFAVMIAGSARADSGQSLPMSSFKGFDFALQNGTLSDRSHAILLWNDLEAWSGVPSQARDQIGKRLLDHASDPNASTDSRAAAAQGLLAVNYVAGYIPIARWLGQTEPDAFHEVALKAAGLAMASSDSAQARELLLNSGKILDSDRFSKAIGLVLAQDKEIAHAEFTDSAFKFFEKFGGPASRTGLPDFEKLLRLTPRLDARQEVIFDIFYNRGFRDFDRSAGLLRSNGLNLARYVENRLARGATSGRSIYNVMQYVDDPTKLAIMKYYADNARALFPIINSSNAQTNARRAIENTRLASSLFDAICMWGAEPKGDTVRAIFASIGSRTRIKDGDDWCDKQKSAPARPDISQATVPTIRAVDINAHIDEFGPSDIAAQFRAILDAPISIEELQPVATLLMQINLTDANIATKVKSKALAIDVNHQIQSTLLAAYTRVSPRIELDYLQFILTRDDLLIYHNLIDALIAKEQYDSWQLILGAVTESATTTDFDGFLRKSVEFIAAYIKAQKALPPNHQAMQFINGLIAGRSESAGHQAALQAIINRSVPGFQRQLASLLASTVTISDSFASENKAEIITYLKNSDLKASHDTVMKLIGSVSVYDSDELGGLSAVVLRSQYEAEPLIAALLTSSWTEQEDLAGRLRAMAYFVAGARDNALPGVIWLRKTGDDDAWLQPLKGKRPEVAGIFASLTGVVPHLKANHDSSYAFAAKARKLLRTACDEVAAEAPRTTEAAWSWERLKSLASGLLGFEGKAPCWAGEDAEKLKSFAQVANRLDPDLAVLIAERLKRESADSVKAAMNVAMVAHPALWLALLLASPYSLWLQSVFFWNKTVREVGGLWYVSALIGLVPAAQRHLLKPFAGPDKALVADAELARFDPQGYFEKGTLANELYRPGDSRRNVGTAVEFLRQQRGSLTIIGESGLGKTMLLRRLVLDWLSAGEVVVFLNAERCDGGVLAAIAAKLEGVVADETFLRTMIHRRVLRIVIDGLNEVGIQTRTHINQFVEKHRGANIIVASQPMDWDGPTSVPVYRLQALTPELMRDFLLTRPVDPGAPGAADYPAAVDDLLRRELDPARPKTEIDTAKLSLSNPMDLTLVGEILASGTAPQLDGLVAQMFANASALFAGQNGGAPFPLQPFCKHVFERRKADRLEIDEPTLGPACAALEREKILIYKPDPAPGYHIFRHDRFGDFFRAQALFPRPLPPRGATADKDPAWATEFENETRFRGAYLQFAAGGPLDDAAKVAAALRSYAVQRRDYSLWAEFERRLTARLPPGQPQPHPAGPALAPVV